MDILRAAHAAGLDAADELLRLDDGTPLPPELSEIRSLMLLKSELEGAPAAEPSAEENSSPAAARLVALQAQKAAHVADCLLAFDDASLFLHERVLEHERLVERLSALRRRGQTKRAAPQRAFDEAFEADDGVDSLGDWLDDAHLTPGLALRTPLSAAAPGAAAAAAPADDDEDEEALDQRLASSRQQIKALLASTSGAPAAAPATAPAAAPAAASPNRGHASGSASAVARALRAGDAMPG